MQRYNTVTIARQAHSEQPVRFFGYDSPSLGGIICQLKIWINVAKPQDHLPKYVRSAAYIRCVRLNLDKAYQFLILIMHRNHVDGVMTRSLIIHASTTTFRLKTYNLTCLWFA